MQVALLCRYFPPSLAPNVSTGDEERVQFRRFFVRSIKSSFMLVRRSAGFIHFK